MLPCLYQRKGGLFYGHVHTLDCCLITTRATLITTERSYTRWKYQHSILQFQCTNISHLRFSHNHDDIVFDGETTFRHTIV